MRFSNSRTIVGIEVRKGNYTCCELMFKFFVRSSEKIDESSPHFPRDVQRLNCGSYRVMFEFLAKLLKLQFRQLLHCRKNKHISYIGNKILLLIYLMWNVLLCFRR